MALDRELARRQAADHANIIRLLAGQQTPTITLDGVIQSGSYDPTTGTCAVVIGDTAGISDTGQDDTDEDQPIVLSGLPLLVPSYGFQYGPVGGERCLMIVRQGGIFGVLIDYDEDDSPQAPAGETWIVKRNLSGSPDPNVYLKLVNDGTQQGDGNGGWLAFAQGLLQLVHGDSNSSITLDDNNGGEIVVDAANYAALLGPLVELGQQELDATEDAVLRVADFQDWVNNVLVPYLAASVQAGSGAPSVSDQITGSSIVKAAP